jgi:hypothetical protein
MQTKLSIKTDADISISDIFEILYSFRNHQNIKDHMVLHGEKSFKVLLNFTGQSIGYEIKEITYKTK